MTTENMPVSLLARSGFKATPGSGWCNAWTIAKDEPHALNADFTLERFHQGFLIDEKGAGATPGYH